MPDFVHLHVHSQYSMLEGAIRVKELCTRVKEMGMNAVALTDHGNMHGAIDFYKKANDAGVHAILGCELGFGYAFPGDRPDKNNRHRSYHLPLLAASNEGYKNLVAIVSHAWRDAPDGAAPQSSLDRLAAHAKGMVVLTGCLGGLVSQALLQQSPAMARQVLGQLKEMLDPGALFVELQDHGLVEQPIVNRILVEMARELDLPIVATNDAHYLRRDDATAQRVLTCIAAGMTLEEANAALHNSDEMFLKSPEEMAETFGDLPEALANTRRVAEMCQVKLKLGDSMLPNYRDDTGAVVANVDDYFAQLCRQGLEERFKLFARQGKSVDVGKYRDRLETEIKVIQQMKFPGYFLIVQDFINWGKKNGVPVGPGRGSGAGSIVAYALGITDIDPIPYDLLFERFLNPERVSMPDFDVDFCMLKRERVIEYVRNKYGADSVGQIATFQILKAKSCVRDVGRVMGMTYQEVDAVAKLVPDPVQGKTVSLNEALEKEPRLKAVYEENEGTRALIDLAMKVENLNRHAGMHAAGIVISEGPLWDTVPIFKGSGGEIVTQYAKDEVEAAGLVKFDFLGLTTLTVIDFALGMIRKRPDQLARVAQGELPFAIEDIPMEPKDPDARKARLARETFELLQSGETTGVFQLESSGMQKLFKDLRPDCFEDIVAAVALYRPGPLGTGMVEDFVNRKNGKAKVAYPHDDLKEVLKDTYGVIVYQEQVMMIARKMAGYTLGGADLLRRAMGKKKAEEMAKQKATFVEGAKKLNYDEAKAIEVFDLLEYFAGYGFNKCVVGDTVLHDAMTGEQRTVRALFETRTPFFVHALGEDQKLRPRAVVDVVSNGRKRVFEVRTALGKRIVATANHPLRVLDGWRLIEDLHVGDRVATPRRLDVATTRSWASHELIALAGLLSDGDTCHPSCLYYFNDSAKLIDDFAQACIRFEASVARVATRTSGRVEVCVSTGRDARFHAGQTPSNARGNAAVAMASCSAPHSGMWRWAESLGLLGVHATEKRVPPEVFALRDDDLALLLGRMWAGHGFLANATRGVPFFTTSSEGLARDIQTLLLRLGILSRVYERHSNDRDNTRRGHTVRLLGDESIAAFVERVLPHCVGRDVGRAHLLKHLAHVKAGRSSNDTIPGEVRHWVDAERRAAGLTWTELQTRSGVSMEEFTGRGSSTKHSVRRTTIARLAEFFGSERLRETSSSDVYWDRVVSIEARGIEETYDLTVDVDHNFVADGLIVHNSHSAAYALITYQTAYLKRHFPVEFMAATLCSDLGKIEKIVGTINEARAMGIDVLVPDVNESDRLFTVIYEAKPLPVARRTTNRTEADPYRPRIRVGLGGIKGVGDAAIESIIEARRQGPFQDLFDFTSRIDPRRVNKSVLEALVCAGAFDKTLERTGATRAQAYAAIEKALERGKGAARERSSGQMGLFTLAETLQPTAGYPDVQPWDLMQRLKLEREALGLYLTGHPLDRYAAEAARFATVLCAQVQERENGEEVSLAGVIEAYREKVPKAGGRMAFFFLEDRSGRVEAIVRPKTYDSVADQMKEGQAVLVTGRVKVEFKRDEEGNVDEDVPEAQLTRSISVDMVAPLGDALRARTKGVTLRLTPTNLLAGDLARRRLAELKKILAEHPGRCPLNAVLKLPERGEVVVSLPKYRIDPSEEFLAKIERVFGEKVAELRS